MSRHQVCRPFEADIERGLEWMLGLQGSQKDSQNGPSLRIAKRFPALVTALFRVLDEDGDGQINVEALVALDGSRLGSCTF